VAFGDLPIDFAATHYVGIAGVGLDAGSYKRNDPATIHKRGAFSYDESATLAEIIEGRGVSNTILMAQVPHDQVTGVSPWIAGGGATVRGVPEDEYDEKGKLLRKHSAIQPFVSTTKDGKAGTYVMMADGSVRFIDQNVSDDVFRAMCTINGPAPPGFDVTKDPNIALIPAPAPKAAKEPDKKPADKTPPKADPPKKDPGPAEKKDAPAKDAPQKTSWLTPDALDRDLIISRWHEWSAA
jgi:hypothetical protein